jgi:hypothetical protein
MTPQKSEINNVKVLLFSMFSSYLALFEGSQVSRFCPAYKINIKLKKYEGLVE